MVASITIPVSYVAASGPIQSAMAPPGATLSPLCGVQISNPHISTYYQKQGQTRVKVNAQLICSAPVPHLTLTVALWKSSFWSFLGQNNKINQTQTSNSGQSLLKNQGTASPTCNSNKSTSYWGEAIAQSVEPTGTYYDDDKSQTVQIPCGT